ncbi:MAG: hypothetical protein ABJN96_10410 [Marinomonas sp.]
MNQNHLLVCSSYKEIELSSSNILKISLKVLLERLDRIEKDLSLYDFSREVESLIFEKLEFTTIWFHASRTTTPNAFKEHGIKTTSQIKPEIESKLQELSEGLSRKGLLVLDYQQKKLLTMKGHMAIYLKTQY